MRLYAEKHGTYRRSATVHRYKDGGLKLLRRWSWTDESGKRQKRQTMILLTPGQAVMLDAYLETTRRKAQ